MTLSLDATVVVDVLRGHEDVRRRFEDALGRGEELVVSALVLHELFYGAWRSGRTETKLKEVDVFLRRVQVEAFQGEDALAAGRLRADLAENGGPAAAYDELIAGQALARGWTLVTSNLRHFIRMRDLPVADWRLGGAPFSAAERAKLILELMKAEK